MNFKKIIRSRIFLFFLLGVFSFFLTACTNPISIYKDVDKSADKTSAQLDATRDQKAYTPYTSDSAVLQSSVSNQEPAWINNRISVHGQNLPFSFWVGKILSGTNATINYDDSVNQNMTASMDYSGTIRGALDKLAAGANYAYSLNCNNISWSNFVTKTFDVSFMPGALQYQLGGQSSGGSSTASSSSNSGAPAQALASQFSNMQANLSVWTDLQNAIKPMLSKDGQVMVSQATTTITVRDHPQNVRLVGSYLASMNKDLSRQVSLQVQVLQIQLNKGFDYGIDWSLVATRIGTTFSNGTGNTALGTDFTNSMIGGNAFTTQAGSTSAGPQLFGLALGVNHSGNGYNALINALTEQGKVSTVTNPRVVTLNNQVGQIAITTQTTYLASVTTTVASNSGAGAQTSLTPGTVTTGFTLYVLPKIINGNIFLQLTSELSNLDKLTTFTSGSGSNAQQITGPVVSDKAFNQRAMVPSGYTLVLSGFRQVQDETNNTSLLGLDPLGNHGANENATEILVLITPTIISNNG